MARLDHVAITRRRQAHLARIATTTGVALQRRWRALGSYDRADQERWATAAEPVVLAGQNQAIDVQAAYLGARLDGPVNVRRAAALEAAAVDLREPFIAYANALSKGAERKVALESAALRATGLGESSVYWAARAANTTIRDSRIVGWTRTLTGNACTWCVAVAGQTYRTAESASFGHQRCDCGVDPIVGDSDPGRVINDELISADS